MRIFTYSGIRREDCEGVPCSYSLGWARVAVSRLISAGFLQYWSAPPGGSTLGDGLSLHWRDLEYLIWPIFPALFQDLLLCRWVCDGDQTLEAGIGKLFPVSLVSWPPWVGS